MIPLYQQFFSPDGEPLHDKTGKFSIIHYWNDACWRRSIPDLASGLTYLDVGCNLGYYLMRFEQRGGIAIGLDFDLLGGINSDGEKFSGIGTEHNSESLQSVRNTNAANYKVMVGGFGEHGNIIPPQDKFDVVSSLNVIEYMDNPKACVKSLFGRARERVIVATDVCVDRGSYEPGIIPPLRWITGIDDIKSWMEWPYVYWTLELLGEDPLARFQAFFVSTRPGSGLPEIDISPYRLRRDLPEMEIIYREGRGVHKAQPPQFYDDSSYEIKAHNSKEPGLFKQ